MNCFKKVGENADKCKSGAGLYFVGFIGSAVYFIGHAAGFWDGVLGLLKATVWPGFLVYQAFEFLAK
jgi:hypothetical protein